MSFGIAPGRQQQDGNEGQRRIRLEPLHDLDAVELRHHHVEQHEVGQLGADLFERLLAIAGNDDVIAEAFEAGPDDIDIVRHVVDDEDFRRLTHFASRNWN